MPEGFSKSPTGRGDRWRRFPTKNPNLMHIFYKSYTCRNENVSIVTSLHKKIINSWQSCPLSSNILRLKIWVQIHARPSYYFLISTIRSLLHPDPPFSGDIHPDLVVYSAKRGDIHTHIPYIGDIRTQIP